MDKIINNHDNKIANNHNCKTGGNREDISSDIERESPVDLQM